MRHCIARPNQDKYLSCKRLDKYFYEITACVISSLAIPRTLCVIFIARADACISSSWLSVSPARERERNQLFKPLSYLLAFLRRSSPPSRNFLSEFGIRESTADTAIMSPPCFSWTPRCCGPPPLVWNWTNLQKCHNQIPLETIMKAGRAGRNSNREYYVSRVCDPDFLNISFFFIALLCNCRESATLPLQQLYKWQ